MGYDVNKLIRLRPILLWKLVYLKHTRKGAYRFGFRGKNQSHVCI